MRPGDADAGITSITVAPYLPVFPFRPVHLVYSWWPAVCALPEVYAYTYWLITWEYCRRTSWYSSILSSAPSNWPSYSLIGSSSFLMECSYLSQSSSWSCRHRETDSQWRQLRHRLGSHGDSNSDVCRVARLMSRELTRLWLKWVESELNQGRVESFRVGRENQGYESSQSGITLIVIWVRVESTGYCLSQSWVADFSKEKTSRFCIYL